MLRTMIHVTCAFQAFALEGFTAVTPSSLPPLSSGSVQQGLTFVIQETVLAFGTLCAMMCLPYSGCMSSMSMLSRLHRRLPQSKSATLSEDGPLSWS